MLFEKLQATIAIQTRNSVQCPTLSILGLFVDNHQPAAMVH